MIEPQAIVDFLNSILEKNRFALQHLFSSRVGITHDTARFLNVPIIPGYMDDGPHMDVFTLLSAIIRLGGERVEVVWDPPGTGIWIKEFRLIKPHGGETSHVLVYNEDAIRGYIQGAR